MTEPVLEAAAMERLHRLGGDSLVQQMIALFLEHAPTRQAAVRTACDAADANALERAAHTLKSTAGNLGATRLQRTAETVEALAAEGTVDADLCRRLVTECDEAVEALRVRASELSP